MKNITKITIFSIASLFLFAAAVVAAPPAEAPFQLPEQAREVSQGVFSLGEAIDPQTGKKVEGIAFIHYKKGFHHKPNHTPGNGGNGGGNGNGDDSGSTCYAFLSNGAKWNANEPWMLNGTNSHGLSANFLLENTAGNIQKWEDAASANVFGDGELVDFPLSAEETSPDGNNEVFFGEIEGDSSIAVTIVWGIFRGPPSQRGLVEWDQVYDDSSFTWANNGNPDDMDFENISTHEVGHALGMGHPGDSCNLETMFRFATQGEINKRDLHDGDIAGIAELY